MIIFNGLYFYDNFTRKSGLGKDVIIFFSWLGPREGCTASTGFGSRVRKRYR